MPTRNGAPVPPPDDYEKTDSGKTYIDMQQLFDDMYIRIGIKYDDDKKRYIWRFMDISNTAEEIEINLYEPRVNNTDE
jgi:pantothenate kinase